MRTALGLLLVVSLFQASAPAPGAWPPPGVYTEKDGVTKPEVITKVTPTYAREAMRKGIQGFVALQFVVEADGSVGPVHVVTSLDVVNGLDDAAINALKQWRFKPGTKDGVPVRVLSTALQSFVISALPPPMTLPAGFDPGPPSSATTWTREDVEANGVRISFAYPDGYERHDLAGPVIGAVDQKSFHSASVSRPKLLAAAIPFPMPIPELARFSESMRLQFSRGGSGMEAIAVGQAMLGTTNWLWLESEASSSSFQGAPPELAVMIREKVDGARIWSFSTSVGTNLVQVLCIAPELTGATSAARDASIASARSECSEILKRISFTGR